jgi:hypothetical protein
MPLVRIDVVEGWTDSELMLLLDALHEAMVKAFDVPVRDRYQVLTRKGANELVLEDTGLGFERSHRRILVQVFTRPRSTEQKRKFYALSSSILSERLRIATEDLMITCVTNSDSDWSFAHGRPQFLTGELGIPLDRTSS